MNNDPKRIKVTWLTNLANYNYENIIIVPIDERAKEQVIEFLDKHTDQLFTVER